MYAHFLTISVIIIYTYEDTYVLRRLVLIVLYCLLDNKYFELNLNWIELKNLDLKRVRLIP